MSYLAILLAALGSFGYAIGARLQHSGVQETTRGEGLGVRSQLRLLHNRRWLLGLVALASGMLLHASALGFAPLSVVQPVGVLALPITVLLTARERRMKLRDFHPNVGIGVMAAMGGVGVFVVLAATTAQATEVGPQEQALATRFIAVFVVALGLIGLVSRSVVRCVAYAAGCAVAYGYVSLLMRAVVQKIGPPWLDNINLLPLLGVVTAVLVGAWLLQHAYASGPPDLVVACLTVIDPLVAVGLGIGLLGEADQVTPMVATGEAVCALIACAGVFTLARYHPGPEQKKEHATVSGGRDLAGPSSTDRPNGSST